jgi:hypothetical protein
VIWGGGRLRRLALAVSIVFAAGLVAETGAALEPPSGSRNFTAPNHVPNYFSNESGPFRGGGAGQTASPGAGPVAAVPVGRGTVASGRFARQKSVHAGRQRARLARGKVARHHAARARLPRGGKAVVGRSAPVRSKASAARAAPAKARGGKAPGGKGQRVARARG